MKSCKRRIWPGLITVIFTAMAPLCDAAASRSERPVPPIDPLSLYGKEIYFDVYRKGDKIGFHRVQFGGQDAELIVRSEFKLQINVLFLTAFRYLYQSEGRWRQGQLVRLKVTVNDDGKTTALDVMRSGDRLRIENTTESFTASVPLFPTNHWNPEVLRQTRVLNTLTGRINRVRIEPQAQETVATEHGDVPATRYAYTGELETEVWYDDAGRWVKMRFKGRDGSTIEYVCRRCQGGTVVKVQQ